MKIPVFPLSVVLFPGQVLPLNIFEPRYKAMLDRCLREGMGFGVALIKHGRAEGNTPATPFSIGTIAQITHVEEQGNGTYAVICKGENRFRIEALSRHPDHYLEAEVQIMPDEAAPPPALLMVAHRVANLFDEYYRSMIALSGGWQREIGPGGRTWLFDLPLVVDRHTRLMEARASGIVEVPGHMAIPALPEDPASLSFVVAGELNVSLEIKQELLEAPSVLARLQREAEVLTEDMPEMEQRVRAEHRRHFTQIEQLN